MLRAPSIDAAGLSGAAAHEDEHPYSDVGVCAPRGTERWDFGEGVEVWRPGHQLVWQGDRDDRGGQLHAHVDGRAAAPGGIRAAEPDTSEGAPPPPSRGYQPFRGTAGKRTTSIVGGGH